MKQLSQDGTIIKWCHWDLTTSLTTAKSPCVPLHPHCLCNCTLALFLYAFAKSLTRCLVLGTLTKSTDPLQISNTYLGYSNQAPSPVVQNSSQKLRPTQIYD